LALKEQKEEWAILGHLVSQGLEDRKDGKVRSHNLTSDL
jgi:hypothetical protein